MKTTKLDNGKTVLAKETRFGVQAIGYANRTQAENAASRLRAEGVDCQVWKGARPFFVEILNIPESARLPEGVISFGDVFDVDTVDYGSRPPGQSGPVTEDRRSMCRGDKHGHRVGWYVIQDRGWGDGGEGRLESFYARPSAGTMTRICENMLIVTYDTIHFKIVRHGETSRVFACYGQIIGSHIVADIRTDSIPGKPE